MIDFKITFQNDELLYGDYEKVNLISKIMFRNFLRQFNPSVTKGIGTHIGYKGWVSGRSPQVSHGSLDLEA